MKAHHPPLDHEPLVSSLLGPDPRFRGATCVPPTGAALVPNPPTIPVRIRVGGIELVPALAVGLADTRNAQERPPCVFATTNSFEMSGVHAAPVKTARPARARLVAVMTEMIDHQPLRNRSDHQLVGDAMGPKDRTRMPTGVDDALAVPIHGSKPRPAVIDTTAIDLLPKPLCKWSAFRHYPGFSHPRRMVRHAV